MLFDLEYDEVNLVLKALSTQPYIDVYAIISKIHDQHDNGLPRESSVSGESPVEDLPQRGYEHSSKLVQSCSPSEQHPNDLSFVDNEDDDECIPSDETSKYDSVVTPLRELKYQLQALLSSGKTITQVNSGVGDEVVVFYEDGNVGDIYQYDYIDTIKSSLKYELQLLIDNDNLIVGVENKGSLIRVYYKEKK